MTEIPPGNLPQTGDVHVEVTETPPPVNDTAQETAPVRRKVHPNARGNAHEKDILQMLTTAGWTGHRATRKPLFLPGGRIISRPNDIWSAHDIVALRPGTSIHACRVLGVQVGPFSISGAKKTQAEIIRDKFDRRTFASTVWLFHRLRGLGWHYVVYEDTGRAEDNGWELIGRCRTNGSQVNDLPLPWPLLPP